MKPELDYTYDYRVIDEQGCISARSLFLADWVKATSAVRSQLMGNVLASSAYVAQAV